MHGRIAATRKMAHHMLANELAARFDTVVVVEDLTVKGMTHNRPLASVLGLRDSESKLPLGIRWFTASVDAAVAGIHPAGVVGLVSRQR